MVSAIADRSAVVVTILVKVEPCSRFAALVSPAAPGQVKTVTITLLVSPEAPGQIESVTIAEGYAPHTEG